MIEAAIAVAGLILGLALLVYCGDKAVEHSIIIASALRVSPLMIGLILVSLGTDLPEIANSIASSAAGHADINVGDSLGSVLTQITLVLGLLSFFGGKFKVRRKEALVAGACLVLALILAVSIAEKGYFTTLNALFLMAIWPILMFMTRSAIAKEAMKKEDVVAPTGRKNIYHFIITILGFVGVAIGAYAVVQSVITLSAVFQISEYLISFFVVAIGTSLPELAVELTAIRKKQYELAIGDAIGSCILDASLSIGIGLLLFPQAISGQLVMTTGLYAIFASLIVVSALALREKLDKKAGALFIMLYLFSYELLVI